MIEDFSMKNLVHNCLFMFGIVFVTIIAIMLGAVLWPIWVIYDLLFNKDYRNQIKNKLIMKR